MVEFDLEFMGKEWDSFTSVEFQKWNEEWAREALRICKPGAFMFVFGGSRTFHRLACAIEDVGWILRDTIMWVHGQGFPKGLDVSKSIDKKLGKEREVVGQRKHPTLKNTNKIEEQANAAHGENKWAREWDLTAPSSDQAKLFEGYNVSFKPAFEPILVCMKPNDGGFADNALKWGIAGINVDAGRIGGIPHHNYGRTCAGGIFTGKSDEPINTPSQGRYPANLILSHSPDCVRIGEKKVKGTKPHPVYSKVDKYNGWGNITKKNGEIVNKYEDENGNETIEEWDCSPSCPIRQMNESVGIKKSGLLKAGHPYGLGDGQNVYAKLSGVTKSDTHADEGHVSRYFKNLPPETPRFIYNAKASRSERNKGCEHIQEKEVGHNRFDTCAICGGYILQNPDRPSACKCENPIRQHNAMKGNFHPTCKPLNLIKELCKLLQMPQNTLILDMFAGSGTLGVACEQLKIPYILIEKEEEYCDIIRARVAAANEPDKPVKRKKIQKPTNTLIPWEEISNDQNA